MRAQTPTTAAAVSLKTDMMPPRFFGKHARLWRNSGLRGQGSCAQGLPPLSGLQTILSIVEVRRAREPIRFCFGIEHSGALASPDVEASGVRAVGYGSTVYALARRCPCRM